METAIEEFKYEGEFSEILTASTNLEDKNVFLAALLEYEEQYKLTMEIMRKYDLVVFKRFSSPNYKSISFTDMDDFRLFESFKHEFFNSGFLFDTFTKETDSGQFYSIIIIKDY